MSYRAITGVLLLGLLSAIGWAPRAQAWGLGHNKITQAACAVLPEWQRKALGKTQADLVKNYCLFPDRKDSPEVKPYVIPVEERTFHYMPRVDVAENQRYFTAGASLYLEQILARLKEGKTEEAAKYLGYLLHILEDAGLPGIHSLEGFNGLTWTQLGEIIQPPDGSHPLYSPKAVFQVIIDFDAMPEFAVNIAGYRPRYLGTSTPEIAFHLYQDYVAVVRAGRRAAVPAAERVYAGDRSGAAREAAKAAQVCGQACADLIYTCLSAADNRADATDLAGLEKTDLTTLEPASVPLFTNLPYRFTPLILQASLGRWRQVYPLELWIEAGGKKEKKTFPRGFSTGMVAVGYDLPPHVFSRLDLTAGIHATLGSDDWNGTRLAREAPAAFQMAIKLNGQTLWESKVLEKDALGEKVSVPVLGGGRLEFVSTNQSRAETNHANQPVWAEPVLIRAPLTK